MKTPFALVDFSGGMKGKKGQLNSADIKHLQDINNFVVERNNTLKSRNGVEEIPLDLLKYDKVLPFISNGRKFYFVYDPLLNLKYGNAGQFSPSRSMGGQRFIDIHSKVGSSLGLFDYLWREAITHFDYARADYTMTYTKETDGFPEVGDVYPQQDDATKWAYIRDFDIGTTSALDMHLYLRKLTWEASPTCVITDPQMIGGLDNMNTTYQRDDSHPVIENTFWWNRMFVLDENYQVITTEIDMANFVTYDSGHEVLTPIPVMDTEVRDASHADLQTIRETRYGGSDLEYTVEVMNQGVMFYNKDGKLPTMFMQLNDQGQTDGVLRDFRTLYLSEVPNGIFKTAPYFTLDHYAAQTLYDEVMLLNDIDACITDWDWFGAPMLSVDTLLAIAAIKGASALDYASNDFANNPNVAFSYDVTDPENASDVVKAFLPMTSDANPAVAIDNIRFDEPDGQVRFASPSFANLDRDYLFPHDQELVWQDTDLAAELPFIFSPNLVVYYTTGYYDAVSGAPKRYSRPILHLQRTLTYSPTIDYYSLIPRTRYAGGSIGKFGDNGVPFRPIRIKNLTSSSSVTTEDADYLKVVVYVQVFGIYMYSASNTFDYKLTSATFPVRLGYFTGNTFYALQDFKAYVTTYSGSANASSKGWFSTTSAESEYSFKIFYPTGGDKFSVIGTATRQLSKAFGFNAGGYFSAVSEFAGRLYLASVSAPNRFVYSSTQDYLEFSVVRALVNATADPVVTRGGRELLGNEQIQALHESNNHLRVITDRRIFTVSVDEQGLVSKSDPSDIVTSGKEPITINNYTYFVSGDDHDILLAVFSDKTQRFEYYSVFSSINIDDNTPIKSVVGLAASYRLVVLTGEGIYVGTIIQANQVAWSRLTFTFDVLEISSTAQALYLTAEGAVYELNFLTDSDIEDGVIASIKMLAPTAMANFVSLPKTNINYIGLRYHDVTVVGTFNSLLQSGSDAQLVAAADQGDVIDVSNKNYNDIYDSIEISFERKQNRIIYIRGSLGS